LPVSVRRWLLVRQRVCQPLPPLRQLSVIDIRRPARPPLFPYTTLFRSRRLAVRLLDASPGRSVPTWPRVVGHALFGLPLDVLASVVAGYGWAVVVLNIAYPVRLLAEPDTASLTADAWGGPTLAGAWLVHGLAGLVALWLVPLLVVGITQVQLALRSGERR